MTVAVGFHCTDGLVLAADSELSNSTIKFSGTKAWIYRYPKGTADPVPLAQVAIVGAGDAAFLQYASERIDGALDDYVSGLRAGAAVTMPAINSIVQGVVNDIHHNHLYPVSQFAGERPAIQLIIGVWLRSGRIRLMRTNLTAITKVWDYEASGSGSDLANFIIKRFYGGRVAISQAVFIASEALKHAKDFVPGCGGQTNVIVMYQNGLVGTVTPDTIEQHEGFLKLFDEAIAPVFFGGPDVSVNDAEFASRVDALARRLKSVRQAKAIEENARQVSADAEAQQPTPSAPAQRGRATRPVRKSPKRGRKDRPPSQG